ncbi:MAG: PDZ domain-containing protein [gamma proteobacterium symbiont of Phacoides pectinatus]
MTKARSLSKLSLLASVVLVAACGSTGTTGPGPGAPHPGDVPSVDESAAEGAPEHRWSGVDLRAGPDMDRIIEAVGDARVVYVGESHELYGHHMAQLEVLRRLHQRYPEMAIGMEMFQIPFQSVLDAYVRGEFDEREMLRGTEWFERWRYDFRLYRPLVEYARRHGLPIIALNVSNELRERVSEVGVAGLSDEERSRIPAELDKSDQAYRERLRMIFHRHAGGHEKGFERFEEVQLLWDESMAAEAARYLRANPSSRLVVFAGSGHLMHGSGIPNRVQRRIDVPSAIILPGDRIRVEQGIADFLIFPPVSALPKAGVMGVYLGESEQPGASVEALVEESAAARAGVEKDDLITAIDDVAVASPEDVKLELLGRAPGERIRLRVLRRHLLLGDEELDFDFALGE